MGRLRVGLYAMDPLRHAGLASSLRTGSDFDVQSTAERGDFDVGVFLADRLTPEETAALYRWTDATNAPVVLVVNQAAEAELRAVARRVVSVLPQHAATAGRLARSVREAASLPAGTSPRVDHLLDSLKELTGDPPVLHEDNTPRLTARERDVLRMIADGKNTAEIAQALSYSERTVKGVIVQVTRRLALRNRAHAVAYAIRAGLI